VLLDPKSKKLALDYLFLSLHCLLPSTRKNENIHFHNILLLVQFIYFIFPCVHKFVPLPPCILLHSKKTQTEIWNHITNVNIIVQLWSSFFVHSNEMKSILHKSSNSVLSSRDGLLMWATCPLCHLIWRAYKLLD